MTTTERITSVEEKYRWLRDTFNNLGLEVSEIVDPLPDDLEQANRWLVELLDWVIAYRKSPSRRALERKGYQFPPVEPDCDPDTDWLLFERWVQGKPVRWSYEADFGPLPAAGDLSDAELAGTLETVIANLAEHNVLVDYHRGIPDRLAYEELRRYLRETRFEFMVSNATWHLDGCGGYCPGCFQRPWCPNSEESWPEDEEAGHTVFPDICKPYVDNHE